MNLTIVTLDPEAVSENLLAILDLALENALLRYLLHRIAVIRVQIDDFTGFCILQECPYKKTLFGRQCKALNVTNSRQSIEINA
jgi:hypothetical protein